MSERKKNLFIDFRGSSKADWVRKAATGLKNEDAYNKYRWQFEEGFIMDPYYDVHDLEAVKNGTGFQNRLLKKNGTNDSRHWKNIQKIYVTDIPTANAAGLEALNNGADGITFDLSGMSQVSFADLLKNISAGHTNLSFIAGKAFNEHLAGYCNYLAINKIDARCVQGYFTTNTTPIENEQALEAFRKTVNYSGLKVLHTQSQKTHVTDEIADLLLQTVKHFEFLTGFFGVREVIDKIALVVRVSTDYFGEIAKLRAIRMLFFQLSQALGHKDFNPEDLYIHCISPAWTNASYQPHANMLKSTTAAMSAILGGCDSLQVEPEDYNDPLMVRIARNVSTILKEESYLSKTADPVAGSYYIEILTDRIAQKAWQVFQEKWKLEVGSRQEQ